MLTAFVQRSSVPAIAAIRSSAAVACLEAVRQGDPAAAQTLYTIYGNQVRNYLRRNAGFVDVEATVFTILVQTVRTVRDLGIDTIEQLTGVVSELCRQRVGGLRRGAPSCPAMTLDRTRDVVNRLFSALDTSEREILLRSCVLSQRDDEISNHVAVPVMQIRRTRAKARVLFRICCDTGIRKHASSTQK